MTSLRLCLERDRFNNILDSSDHFLLHARLSHCSYLPPGNITSTWMRGHRMNNQVVAFLVGIVMVRSRITSALMMRRISCGEVGPWPVMAIRDPPSLPVCCLDDLHSIKPRILRQSGGGSNLVTVHMFHVT
ncbi:hypothetical protein AVEN_67722-1 [Araneus ventricosus]|uniref:Uncharacterized protein n=1 Tax=Araneus ventricosus TaxID=182803 RepID=A0A4Y2S8D5_ARAVE|nr:hypothetical protein AVEN_67722-1 [Araneus ventricosus]